MSIELIAAICAGIVSIITAVGVIIIAYRNGTIAKEDAIKKDVKLEEIHVLVNSRLSSALDEIKQLRGYISSFDFSKKVKIEEELSVQVPEKEV